MGFLISSDIEFVNKLIVKYTEIYIKKEFLNYDITEYVDFVEINKGLIYSGLLSYSDKESYKKMALKYATIISTITTDILVLTKCKKIMNRLSIYTYEEVVKKRKNIDLPQVVRSGLCSFEDEIMRYNHWTVVNKMDTLYENISERSGLGLLPV